jgi:hypothetical protein
MKSEPRRFGHVYNRIVSSCELQVRPFIFACIVTDGGGKYNSLWSSDAGIFLLSSALGRDSQHDSSTVHQFSVARGRCEPRAREIAVEFDCTRAYLVIKSWRLGP